MPGEPAIAHQGRLALLLGIKSDREFKEFIREHVFDEAKDVHSLSRLGQLAIMSGMSLPDYVWQHSMLGVSRVVVPARNWTPFGAYENGAEPGYVRSHGMRMHKLHACLCTQCVKEDLDHWKFSWYRRSHQIEGVAWCPTHKIRLQAVTASEPWSRLPQHWVESGQIAEVPGGQESETDFEARYAEIATYMLERPAPYAVESLASVLAGRAQSLDLRCSRGGRRMNLSDLLRRKAPADWLREHWPDVHRKADRAFVIGLDRVISQKTYAQRGTSYLTAMATLWDSTLELHQALRQASTTVPDSMRLAPQIKTYPVEFWQGNVWEEYLRCEGNVGRMSSVLRINRKYLGERLRELGLVALHRIAASPKLRAFMRFEAGESLSKVCQEEKVAIDDVEILIRVACARQATAVRTINESRQSKKSIDSDQEREPSRGRTKALSSMPASVD